MTAVAAPSLSDDRIRIRVLDAIRELKGPFTVPDLVAKTGLPPYQAEAALNQVVKDYRSDLDVDESGNLVYRFDAALAAREDIVKADRARRRKDAFKNGLIAFFKGWTVAMVIVYFVVFVTLLIVALVALAAAKGDRNSSSSKSSSSSGWGSSWSWGWWGSSTYGGYNTHRTRRARRRWNNDTDRKLRDGEDPYQMGARRELAQPTLRERTWYWLFGSAGIKRNPLEREKELLTYLRAKKGLITNADIIALLGVTYEEADAIGTRLVATYDGEMDLTDDAIAVYRFPNLMVTGAPAVQQQTAKLGYLWQVRAEEDLLRAHPAKLVPALNIVNVILAFVMLGFAMPVLGIEGVLPTIGLFAFPMTFSVIFFTLGMVRKAKDLANKGKYERDSIRIALMQLLFTRRTPVKYPTDLDALEQAGLPKLYNEEFKKHAPEVARELRGEADVDENGRLVIDTSRVLEELSAVERLRVRADSTRPVGRTVFTTRDIAGASPIGDVPEPGQKSAATGADADLQKQIAELEKELS